MAPFAFSFRQTMRVAGRVPLGKGDMFFPEGWQGASPAARSRLDGPPCELSAFPLTVEPSLWLPGCSPVLPEGPAGESLPFDLEQAEEADVQSRSPSGRKGAAGPCVLHHVCSLKLWDMSPSCLWDAASSLVIRTTGQASWAVTGKAAQIADVTCATACV